MGLRAGWLGGAKIFEEGAPLHLARLGQSLWAVW